MEFFNFGLEVEQKLDHHPCVEFRSDSDGNGFNFPKPQPNPQNAPLVPPKKEFSTLDQNKNYTNILL